MEPQGGQVSAFLPAWCDTGSCKKTCDSPQTEEERLKKARSESYKHEARKSRLLQRLSPTPPCSARMAHQEHEKWLRSEIRPLPSFPFRLPQQQNEVIQQFSAQPEHHNVRHQYQELLEPSDFSYKQLLGSWRPVYNSKAKGVISSRSRYQLLPTTAVHHDSYKEHSSTILPQTPLLEMSGIYKSNALTDFSSAQQQINQDLQSVSQERVSKHEGRSVPYPISLCNPSSSSSFPFSAGCDAGSSKKIGLQAKKKKLNDDRSEPLNKNQGSQMIIPEEMTTADVKVSEEGVRNKIPRKRIRRLSHSCSSTSPSSSGRLHDYESWLKSRRHPLPPPPFLLQQQQNKHIVSGQSEHHNVRHQYQESLVPSDLSYNQSLSWSPVCEAKGEIVETRDQDLPTAAVHHDLGIGHYVTSKDSCKVTDVPIYDHNTPYMNLHSPVPPITASNPSVAGPPCPENSTGVFQGSSTGDKQQEQGVPNKLTHLGPLINSAPSSAALNWDGRSQKKPWREMKGRGYFVTDRSSAQRPILVQRCQVKLPRVSEGCSPGFPDHSFSFIPPSTAGPLYPEKKPMVGQDSTSKTGLNLRKNPWGFPVQSPIIQPQQPSESFQKITADLPSCNSSSLSQITSSGNKTFTQQKSFSDMLFKNRESTPDNRLHVPLGGSSNLNLQPFFLVPSPYFESSLSYNPQEGNSKGHGFKSKKKHDKDSFSSAPIIDSPDSTFNRPAHDTLTKTGMIKSHPSTANAMLGVSQDQIREMELHASACPSTCQLSTNDNDNSDSAFHDSPGSTIHRESHASSGWETDSCEYGDSHFLSATLPMSDHILHLLNRQNTDNFDNSSSTFRIPSYSQSKAPTVAGLPCPRGRPAVLQDSTVCTEGSGVDALELLSMQSEIKLEGDSDALMEMEPAVTAVNSLITNTLPIPLGFWMPSDPGWSRSVVDSCLPHSHSMPSLSQISSTKNKSLTRANSSPAVLLTTSCEKFTPDIAADEDEETYRFRCSCPGLYQCSVTGLVFHMDGEGDVVYRTVPWNGRLLSQHHKRPAGPLFDIKCVQQSVRQLHLPHCEILSTGGRHFLSVAHESDEGIEFITPHEVTETHVIIDITGFSAFGNVKDEDSPPDPVRALVLLFYRPPADPEPTSVLNVLLLPRNVVLRDVLRTRKKLVGDESYIETSPHCKLQPEQEYALSTRPEDESVLVQPTEAEFDCDNYDNYFPSFQVNLEKIVKHVKLLLREANSSYSVWERRVCLSSSGVKRSRGPSALNLPPNEKLLEVRSSFIDGISGPVLKSLLDRLLETKVMTDSERESADDMPNKRDKARCVIDMVRKKGEAASSEMIEFLYEADPFLCEHLGLI